MHVAYISIITYLFYISYLAQSIIPSTVRFSDLGEG